MISRSSEQASHLADVAAWWYDLRTLWSHMQETEAVIPEQKSFILQRTDSSVRQDKKRGVTRLNKPKEPRETG